MGFPKIFFKNSLYRFNIFQFPLWDSTTIFTKKAICICLSIPFMGFLRNLIKIEYNLNLLSIPFMGFVSVAGGGSDKTRIVFQFPLWDSYCNTTNKRQRRNYFQFPLWDSYNIMATKKLQTIVFQFPLWDSRPHEFPLRFLFTPLKGSLIYLIRNLLKCFTASDKPILQNSKLSYPKKKAFK